LKSFHHTGISQVPARAVATFLQSDPYLCTHFENICALQEQFEQEEWYRQMTAIAIRIKVRVKNIMDVAGYSGGAPHGIARRQAHRWSALEEPLPSQALSH
jgi:hypothetical protein